MTLDQKHAADCIMSAIKAYRDCAEQASRMSIIDYSWNNRDEEISIRAAKTTLEQFGKSIGDKANMLEHMLSAGMGAEGSA